MIKGEKVRIDIHNILYSIYKYNKTLNNPSIKKIISKHDDDDIAFLNNVVLTSMRFHLHSINIISKYIKKKLRDHEKILLISAITQIVFLEFKDYAVINCSVEIAKKLKIYHGLINASLKKISKDKIKLRKTNIRFSDFPKWFKDKTNSLTIKEKRNFLMNFTQEPSLHIVFKNQKKLKIFEKDIIQTSSISGFLKDKKNFQKIESFKNGDWWVQDFSSFFPLQNLEIKNKNAKILDACAAPGGKSFQLLSRNFNIVLNDKSSSRIEILKNNLNRLNLHSKISNKDFTKYYENKKFDLIIIDAPCSAVGTIRRNPEIFFKKKGPDFEQLHSLQINMLDKASELLNDNGLILYMVCSFLINETKDQIYKFLLRKSEFEVYNFKLINNNIEYLKLIKNSYMSTLPNLIHRHKIDGYFAAYIKKIR